MHIKRVDRRECTGEVIIEMAKQIVERVNQGDSIPKVKGWWKGAVNKVVDRMVE